MPSLHKLATRRAIRGLAPQLEFGLEKTIDNHFRFVRGKAFPYGTAIGPASHTAEVKTVACFSSPMDRQEARSLTLDFRSLKVKAVLLGYRYGTMAFGDNMTR